jgi:hypothetical protein
MSKTEDPMVAALLEERRGYVQRGDKDRVARVDEQLKLHGYEDPEAKKPEPKERAGRESVQVTADDAKPAVKAAEPRKSSK